MIPLIKKNELKPRFSKCLTLGDNEFILISFLKNHTDIIKLKLKKSVKSIFEINYSISDFF